MGEELGLGLQTLENIFIINVADVNRVRDSIYKWTPRGKSVNSVAAYTILRMT